jgi:hypothetical protein
MTGFRLHRHAAALLVAALAALVSAGYAHRPAAAPAHRTSPPPLAGPAHLAASTLTITVTAPASGVTVAAGDSLPLTARLSPDLVTDLAAGHAACSFDLDDDAGTAVTGRLDLGSGTCTATVAYRYSASFAVMAEAIDAGAVRYTSAPVTVAVTGASNPRCNATASAPGTCEYRWAEAYYTAPSAPHYRVCSIDGGCKWQSAHTSWTQLTGKDYWTNGPSGNASALPDGDLEEAYLCIGSSPTDWDDYANTHAVVDLLGRPETSARPVPAGSCASS